MFNEYEPLLQELTFKHLGFQLSDKQCHQFCRYGDLILEWNNRLNLTRIINPQEIILKHFIDSMNISKYISGHYFADLGTGAGFPGIPLKIINPDLDIVLLDSLKKRLDFLEVVIMDLNLQGINTIHSRAENFGNDRRFRERFDSVSSRAVARLPVLLEYALPLLKLNGVFIAAKGVKAQEELADSQKALSILGGMTEKIESYNLGQGAEHRAVLLFRKINKTPIQYPRKAGTPSKQPLV